MGRYIPPHVDVTYDLARAKVTADGDLHTTLTAAMDAIDDLRYRLIEAGAIINQLAVETCAVDDEEGILYSDGNGAYARALRWLGHAGIVTFQVNDGAEVIVKEDG